MNSQDITFHSDGCALAGTVTVVPDPVAAALLIPGSGRSDRNSDVRLPGGRMLRAEITGAIAAALADAGVCSLRFDKRGVGASGGDYLGIGMTQRLADARAALGWLAAAQPGLPLITVGHSEGACYAAQLAAGDDGDDARHDAVRGVVLLSAPARPGADVLAWQTQQLAGRMPAVTRAILRLMRTDVVRAQRRNQDKIMASSADVMRIQGTRINARWFRDFARYDPAAALALVTVPVLALTGGHDLQVPPGDVDATGKLVGGPFEGHVVGDLSHLLRPDPDSVGPLGYRRAVREPVSPEVLRIITAWVTGLWGAR